MDRLEELSARTTGETLAYLARRPYDNVYVSWLIATGQFTRGRVLLRRAAGAVAGVCYYGAQIVPCADEPATMDAFAARWLRSPETRMLVGPRADVERFWTNARARFAGAQTVRRSQPLYALDGPALRPVAHDAAGTAARATPDEIDELAPHSADMIAGEIGGDPTVVTPQFRSRCARIVEAGWWWRYRVDGQLAFMCNVGAATAQTAQIQGVWTPAQWRGGGHATRGLAAICRELLAVFPTLSLYVNDFNVRAIALYERVGFVRVGEFQTILLD